MVYSLGYVSRLGVAVAGFAFLLICLAPAHASQNAALGWDASQSSDVAGYRIYSGTSSGVYQQTDDAGPSTTGTLSGLTGATTYYFAVTAYDSRGLESTPSNEVSFTTPSDPIPTVSITGPAAGSFTEPATLVLSASAGETGGAISRVDFYNGSTFLGEAASAPYTFTWSNVSAGTYSITAQAYDTAGVSAVSDAASITVAMAAPVASSMEVLPDGSIGFSVDGGVNGANRTYSVWTSPDLQSWTLLQTISSATGTFALSDATASSAVSRFYKVSVQ